MARKAARKERRRHQLEEDDSTDHSTSSSLRSSPNLSRAPSLDLAIQDLSMRTRVPILICSVGNPPPTYADTLHSAGHTVLHSIAAHLGKFTPFARDRALGPGGVISYPSSGRLRLTGYSSQTANANNPLLGTDGTRSLDWTLWQSSALMNVSGKGVAEVWRQWRQAVARSVNGGPELAERAQLVVLHDEMEKALGKVTVRRGKDSLRGHNGLKSVAAALGGTNFIRIGIGIDRPMSRDPTAVSKYVLSKMNDKQKRTISAAAGPVIEELINIADEEG